MFIIKRIYIIVKKEYQLLYIKTKELIQYIENSYYTCYIEKKRFCYDNNNSLYIYYINSSAINIEALKMEKKILN